MSTRPWVAVVGTVHAAAIAWAWFASSFSNPWIVASLLTPWIAYVGLAWWLALWTDGRRSCGPLRGVVFLGAGTIAFIENGLLLVLLVACLFVAGVILSPQDPRLIAGIAAVGVISLVSGLPLALVNDDTGLNYWGPIAIYVLVATVPSVVTRWGSTRMVSA